MSGNNVLWLVEESLKGKAMWIILINNFEILHQYPSFSQHTWCYPVRALIELVAYACRNEVAALLFLLFAGMTVGNI